MARVRSQREGLLVLLFAAGALQLMHWTGADDPAEMAFIAAFVVTVVVVGPTW